MEKNRCTTWVAALALTLAVVGVASAAGSQSYWYETYLRIVDLIDEGRYEEAAPQLEALIASRPYSQNGVRIAGAQIIDYCPYYQRARVLLSRGEAKGALHALDISRAFGEMTQTAADRQAVLDLRSRVETAIVADAVRPNRAPAPTDPTRKTAAGGRPD